MVLPAVGVGGLSYQYRLPAFHRLRRLRAPLESPGHQDQGRGHVVTARIVVVPLDQPEAPLIVVLDVGHRKAGRYQQPAIFGDNHRAVLDQLPQRSNVEGGFTAAGHGDALSTFLEVLEQEGEDRRQRRIGRLRTTSRLPAGKTFEHERVPLRLQQQLGELADGDFVDRGVNVLAFGLPGTGKTHALCAVGHRLVEAGRSVLFAPAYRLVQDLLAAKRDLALPRQLRKLDNYDFLLLDDLGYLPQGAEESEVLFTLIAERYERRSLGITSNLVFSQWEHIFANPIATAAAIDRVVHHSVILEFDVPSYRTGVAQQRGQEREVNRQE